MKNNVINTEVFMDNMNIEKIINDVKVDEINYELNIKYYIDEFEEEKVLLKVICDSGFKPNLMFRANFNFSVVVEFEKVVTVEDVEANIEDIFDSMGGEISYLIATLTRSMGGSSLIVPPIVNKIEKIENN